MDGDPFKLKCAKTAFIYASFMFYGMVWVSFSPALLDLKELTSSSLEAMGLSLSFRSIGACIGSFGGAVIYRFGNRELFFAIFIMILGIGSISVGFIKDIRLHYAINTILGLAVGAIEVAGNVTILKVWKERSRPLMQILNLAWTSGAAISPILFKNFLSYLDDHGSNSTASNQTIAITPSQKSPEESRLYIPYSLAGSLLICSGFIALLLALYSAFFNPKFVMCQWSARSKSADISDEIPEEFGSIPPPPQRSIAYTAIMVSLVGLLLFFHCAFMSVTHTFWLPFVINSEIHLDKEKGVYMLSAMSITYMLGNFLGSVAAIWVQPLSILIFVALMTFSGNLIVLLAGMSSELYLWLGVLAVTCSSGSFYASCFSVLQQRLKVTNVFGSILIFVALLPNAAGYSVLIGHFIGNDPKFLIYTNLSNIMGIILCLLSIALIDFFSTPVGRININPASGRTKLRASFSY